MKKLVYISFVALAALVACNKKATTPIEVSPAQQSMPWLFDENLPVPIMFNVGNNIGNNVETKANGLIENAEFFTSNFYFGVVGVAGTGASQVNLFNGGYAVARNAAHANLPTVNHRWAQFVDPADSYADKDYYYPLQSTNNFTFYGYRADKATIVSSAISDATNNFALTNGSQAVEIGSTDIIWGKAAAPTPTNTFTWQGFNARYVRKAWEACRIGSTDTYDEAMFYSTYAPQLNFFHLTSAFQFKVITDKARTSDPTYGFEANTKKFIDADVWVKSIGVVGVHTAATFNVISPDGLTTDTGELVVEEVLTASGLATVAAAPMMVDNTTVVNPVGDPAMPGQSAQFYPRWNNGDGDVYGYPLLVLPTAVEGSSFAPQAVVKFNFPGQENDEEIVTLDLPTPVAHAAVYYTDLTDFNTTNGTSYADLSAFQVDYPGKTPQELVKNAATTASFEPGKKYVFTILVHSPENIEIVTSLEPWDTGYLPDDGVVEID